MIVAASILAFSNPLSLIRPIDPPRVDLEEHLQRFVAHLARDPRRIGAGHQAHLRKRVSRLVLLTMTKTATAKRRGPKPPLDLLIFPRLARIRVDLPELLEVFGPSSALVSGRSDA